MMKWGISLFYLLLTGALFAIEVVPLETGLMLRKRVEVAASTREVFDRFTSVKGVTTFFAPGGRVELGLNGAYEMYFAPEASEGERGSEGCRILSFIPGEMLSFSWNNPPQFPGIRQQHSWVVIRFTPLAPDRTQVDLVHLGFRAGSEWSEALKYFDRAWGVVLGRLAHSISVAPIDWKNPYTPIEMSE